MKQAAILPSTGIGDGLLMMVAAHTLRLAGYDVTTYHPKLAELKEWFVGHTFDGSFDPAHAEKYDLIIAQNNNSKTINDLIDLRTSGKLPQLSIFYPTYKEGKHASLTEKDYVFDGKKTMVENCAACTSALLGKEASAFDNGLIVLPGLTHRLYKNRIIIQPTSTDPTRTWRPVGFVKLANRLKKRGFDPIFTLTQKEREDSFWNGVDVVAPHFENLSALAAYVYESGYVIGNDSMLPHLASNLNIPHLVIGHLEDHMRLWRPGWLKGKLLLPPSWAPNVKFLRWRDRYWKQWITVKSVLSAFNDLLSKA